MSDGPTAERDDGDLVRAALDGDERAFATLMERHEARVLRLLRLLGVPAADREDLGQEVFVRVFRHLSGFRRSRQLGPWLYRITVNVAHDHRRQRRRSLEDPVEDPADLDAVAGDGPAPDDSALDADRARLLEQAIQQLSERERAVFVLVELEQLTTLEAAKSLGITRITVRRHLGRARERLSRLLSS